MLIRHATRSDLDHLAEIEAAADTVYVELFGPTGWDRPHSGHERAAAPGFLLVAADEEAAAPYGFAHVLEVEGQAHLEQLAVRPERHRSGTGTALVVAAATEAAARGHSELTLMTYRDVAWNGPFYARLGFTESAPRTAFERQLARIEERLGLPRHGVRTLMVVGVTPQGLTRR